MKDKIREAGIVGAGGAGFPTYVKLNSTPDIYICNAAECEPLLYTDYYYIERDIGSVIRGMTQAMEMTGAKKGYFAIKSKRAHLFPDIQSAIDDINAPVEIFELGDYYPAGDEQSIVYDVTGRIVPQKGIPIDVGVVVNNVATFCQMDAAISLSKPVTRKYVSVVGRVKRPFVAEVPIGIPFSELIRIAEPEEGTVMIEGGVMMGDVKTPDDVVKKTTGALVFLEEGNMAVREKVDAFSSVTRFSKAACCQCTECTVLCPRFNLGHDIEPHMIMRTLNYGLDSTSHIAQAAYLCCQCGICSMFACPFGLSPKRVYAYFREKLEDYTIPAKDHEIDPFNNAKKVPTKRLKARLGITELDVKPEFIEEIDYSGSLTILLKQHIGVPAEPVVSVGDLVSKNQKIADVPDDKLGVPVHSPVNGRILDIKDNSIIIGSGS